MGLFDQELEDGIMGKLWCCHKRCTGHKDYSEPNCYDEFDKYLAVASQNPDSIRRAYANPDIKKRNGGVQPVIQGRVLQPGDKGVTEQSSGPPNVGAQPHYVRLSPQPIEIIEAWGLDFHLANAVKYIARAGKKPGASAESDLRKAVWYIRRRLGEQELAGSGGNDAT